MGKCFRRLVMIKTKISRLVAPLNPHKYARKQGVKLGNGVKFTGVPDYGSEPWLVEIEDGASITAHIQFITHDGAVYVLRRLDPKYKDVIKFGKIVVGAGSFIGRNAMIMPNVRIGKGAIVGAYSVVTKDVPDGMVAVGNPAKVICSVEEMAERWLVKSPEYDNAELQRDKRKISTEIAEYYWNQKNSK